MVAQEVLLKHGRLYYAARNGRLFHAATAAAGVAPGTAIGTTAAFALHNPADSGVYVAIEKVAIGYISGTLGAGTIWHLRNDDTSLAVPTGTAIAEKPAIPNGGGPQAVALTTATLGAAPVIIRPFASLQASLAATAVAPWLAQEDIEGAIILAPGTTYSLQATAAAGSSPLVAFGVTWEEVALAAD